MNNVIEEPRRDAWKGISLPANILLSLAITLPIFVSAAYFASYDIAMPTVSREMARQFNLPFLIAEMAVIVMAARSGMRPSVLVKALDPAVQIALGVFLLTFMVGGIVNSEVPPFATLYNLAYLVHFMFGCAVFWLARTASAADLNAAPFAAVIAGSFAVFAVLIAAQFLNPPPGRPIESIIWQYAIPGFVSVRMFGAVLAPCVALIAWLALARGGERMLRGWIFLALALVWGLTFWTGTRAAVLAILLVGLEAFFLKGLRPTRDNLLGAAVAVAIGTVIAWLLLPYGDPTFELFTAGDAASAHAVSGGRFSFWSAVWHAYLSVPIFGAGPGATTWILSAEQFRHIQPHNLVLQFLITWGAVATCAALFLLARVVVATHRAASRTPLAMPYLLFADTLLVVGFFDGTFHFSETVAMWVVAIGIVAALGAADTRNLSPGSL